MSDPLLKVGDTVYLFDPNRRIYQEDANGRSIGSPIWIEHWRPFKIIGENRVSWLLERGEKFPKRNGRYTASRNGYGGMEVAVSWEQVKELEWIESHRYAILRLLERCRDAGVMQQVAKLVGY